MHGTDYGLVFLGGVFTALGFAWFMNRGWRGYTK